MNNRYCPECIAIMREMASAHRAWAEECRGALQKWMDDGRSIQEFYAEWLASTAEMLGDETAISDWVRSRPRLVEARQRKAEHEVVSGHSVYLAFSGFWPPMR